METGVCEALVSRTGLFGGVRVEWSAGYPPGQAPVGFKPGVITPSSGKALRRETHHCELEERFGDMFICLSEMWKSLPICSLTLSKHRRACE